MLGIMRSREMFRLDWLYMENGSNAAGTMGLMKSRGIADVKYQCQGLVPHAEAP